MIPDRMMIIEEMSRREQQQAWEPVPLHAPTPMPYQPEPSRSVPSEREGGERGRGGNVIIIDLVDYTETRL